MKEEKKHMSIKTRTKPILSLLIAFTLVLSVLTASIPAALAAPIANFAAQDLTLQPGADATQMNFNWFSDAGDSGTPAVKINGETVSGTQDNVTAIAETNWDKVTVTGLKANTSYTFQVSGNGTDYSQEYSFTTASAGNFTFAAVGDPQMGASGNVANDASGWAATVDEIMSKDASFIAGTGDQINDTGSIAASKENEYASFIAGLNQNGSLMPFSAVMGNHEGDGTSAPGLGRDLFGYHYNVPNAGTQTVNGVTLIDYYYIQNNVLFVVLDTSPYPASTDAATPYIAAYDSELATATATCAGQYDWLIVQTHKSEQSNADHYNDADINAYSLAGFEDLMTKYNVDLVLTGHDHSYTRTYPFTSSGGPLAANGVTIDRYNMGNELVNPVGTIYMTLDSASGSKYYAPKNTPKFTSKIEYQSNKPQYTMIDVTSGKLAITTYETGSGNVIDSFTMQKMPVIKITGVTNGNGQADANFAIRSANGKGYTAYLSESGLDGSFKAYTNVNYDAKGAHIKGLTNGKTYYAYIEYTDGKATERSGVVTLAPSK